jgi:four helix bundle protein
MEEQKTINKGEIMNNFRTYQLALRFYQSSRSLKLTGALKDQFERATLSIPLNLAEGSAKPTEKDRKKFYFIALGSLREVQALLAISSNSKLEKEADNLAAHLYRLCHSLCHSHCDSHCDL